MRTGQLDALLGHIRHLTGGPIPDDLGDAELLERFTRRGDDAAFTALVRRHGPLVHGVCRRVLRHEQDAEDAFQATFFVLARKAATVRRRASLGGWLYEVAYHIALKAGAQQAKRRARERQAERMAKPEPNPEAAWAELLPVLDAELHRLPPKYRDLLVACYLEGKTHARAARELGYPPGSMSRHLARARELLRERLARRGVSLSAGLLAGLLADRVAAAPVSASLILPTVRAALAFARGPASAGGTSARAAALADGAIRALLVGKGQALAVLLFAVVVAAGGAALAARARPETPPAQGAAAVAHQEPAAQAVTAKARERTDRYGDPLPEGAVARLGTVRFRQGVQVPQAVYSPDGKRIAAAGRTGGVCVWDSVTGRKLLQFRKPDSPFGVAFSPEGKYLAIAGEGTATGGTVRLLDPATGKDLRVLQTRARNGIVSLAFSPDGKTLALGTYQEVLVWDMRAGRQIHQLKGHRGEVWSVTFSPDGRLLASTGEDQVVLWDPATGKEVARWTGLGDQVSRVAFSRDGKLLAAAVWREPLRVWDVRTRKLRRVLDVRPRAGAVAFSPDGKTLAAGNQDGRIALWSLADGKEVRHWQAHGVSVHSLEFSPDGRTLLSAAEFDCGPRQWDVATGKEMHAFAGHHGAVVQLAFSADGKELFSGGLDKRILRWDVRTGRERLWFTWQTGALDRFALSPDHTRVATRGFWNHDLRLWDAVSGREIRTLANLGPPSNGSFAAIAFSPDGKRLAASVKERTVRVWDVGSGRELHHLTGLGGEAAGVAFSPDGKTLAASAIRGPAPAIVLWDVATGRLIRAFDTRDEIEVIAFSPDGKLLASTSRFSAISRLWDVATGKELRQLAGAQNSMWGLAFSPDGRYVGGGPLTSKDPVVVWEAATGQVVRRFGGHDAWTWSVAFAPDGRTLASGGWDSTILLWDLTARMQDGQLRQTCLTAGALAERWRALAADAERAYDAGWALVAAPEAAVPFLSDRLKPPAPVDGRHITALIADLDNRRFAVREKAMRELHARADLAEPALRRALAGRPAPEARRRIEALLAGLEWNGSPDRLRLLRALGVLEQIGTPEARRVLQELAGGVPGTPLAKQARAALNRLAGRPAVDR